jgi:hypothetical protein
VGAGLEVDGAAGGEVAARRGARSESGEHLLGEGGQDHVDDGGLQRPPDEPATYRAGWKVANPVGLHPRLLEQPAVDRELPVGRVLRFGQRDVAFDRPALGVLGVERLVQRDAESPQDRPLLERAAGDHLPRAEQRIGVEVDRAGVDLDVAGVREPGAEQRPHGVEALEDRRPVVGEVLVDGIKPSTLGGRSVELLREQPRPHAGCPGASHEVTARG